MSFISPLRKAVIAFGWHRISFTLVRKCETYNTLEEDERTNQDVSGNSRGACQLRISKTRCGPVARSLADIRNGLRPYLYPVWSAVTMAFSLDPFQAVHGVNMARNFQ